MLLKEGYDKETINHNISEMTKAGYSRDRAVIIALAKAKKSRRRRVYSQT
jgi:uncharacterized protein YdaT